MICAEKGNKVITINETDAEKYIALGYNITDGNGSLIQRAIPTDLSTFQSEYIRLSKEIETLKSIIADKDKEIESLKTKKSEPRKKKVDSEN